MESRLLRQLAFVREVDRLKQVVRRTLVTDASRCENSAEHSWQLAVMALTLFEYAPDGAELERVIRMLLVHDLVEIDAGDVYLFDDAGHADKSAREQAAAERIFGLLPAEQAAQLRAWWDEFEARQTPSARFAAALDRIQPMLHNLWTGGAQWHKYGIVAPQVRARAEQVREGAPALFGYLEGLLDEAERTGVLPRVSG